jgi:transposase
VGIAALSATSLHTVAIDEAVIALRTLVEHRDDLVKTRTQTINRLHVLLTQLIPAGAPTGLSADTAAQLLRTVRPRTPMLRTLQQLARDLITEIRRLDSKCPPVTSSATGCPVPGDRQRNHCLHIMAITQISHNTAGRAHYQGKRAAGKSHREALRCLKRRLSDAVYRRLVRDAHDTAAGPGGHPGATTQSSAAGSTPTTDSSDKPLPGPADTEHYNPTTRST